MALTMTELMVHLPLEPPTLKIFGLIVTQGVNKSIMQKKITLFFIFTRYVDMLSYISKFALLKKKDSKTVVGGKNMNTLSQYLKVWSEFSSAHCCELFLAEQGRSVNSNAASRHLPAAFKRIHCIDLIRFHCTLFLVMSRLIQPSVTYWR